jgi:hypothetical protein
MRSKIWTLRARAIAYGAPVKRVSGCSDTKDAATTLNVYASLFEDDLDDVSDRFTRP